MKAVCSLLLSALFLATSAHAAVSPAPRCSGAKLNAAGAAGGQMLRCYGRAARAGGPLAPDCLYLVGAKLETAFLRAELRGGCLATGDVPAVRTALFDLSSDVANGLSSGNSSCRSRKIALAGKLTLAVLRAHARHQYRPDLAARDAAIAEGVARFTTAFTALEASGACPVSGAAAATVNRILVGTPELPPTTLAGVRLVVALLAPACGDGIINGSESCDGAAVGACGALCQLDCTCGPTVCGDGVVGGTEQCDGAAATGCGGPCQPDCSCGPQVCGDGFVGGTEQCEGTHCQRTDLGLVGGCADCGCCDAGYCQMLGCCYDTDICLPTPGYPNGICFQQRCTATRPCPNGYTCIEEAGLCAAQVGNLCAYFNPVTVCVSPAVCPSTTLAFCCFPAGTSCSTNRECCSATCTAGVCS